MHREELTGIQETIEVHTVEPFSEKDTSPIRTHFFPQKFLQDTSLIWTLSSVALVSDKGFYFSTGPCLPLSKIVPNLPLVEQFSLEEKHSNRLC